MFLTILKFKNMYRDILTWNDTDAVFSMFYVVKQFLITKFFNQHYSAYGKDLNAKILCYTMLCKLEKTYAEERRHPRPVVGFS